jgi:sulfotransferase family protein
MSRGVAIESIPVPPSVIGATGGSGTRVVARIAQRCGLYIGTRLNVSKDSLQIGGFLTCWAGQYLAAGDEPDFEDVMRADLARVLKEHGVPADGAPWGWKAPPSIFLLPFFERALPGFRFVHMLRDGRDMAYSRNQRQLDRYGATLVGEGVELDSPTGSIAVWSAANVRAARFGEEHMGGRYLRIRFEDLCAAPEPEIARLLAFLELEGDPAELAAEVSAPPSLGRWREQDPAAIEELERVAGPALERFGYALDAAGDGGTSDRAIAAKPAAKRL